MILHIICTVYTVYTVDTVYPYIPYYIYIWFRACYRRSFLQCFHTRLRSLCFCSAHPCRNDDHRGEKKVTRACHSNSLYLPATVPGLFPGEKKANMGTPQKLKAACHNLSITVLVQQGYKVPSAISWTGSGTGTPDQSFAELGSVVTAVVAA